jgi:hypothetical protein
VIFGDFYAMFQRENHFINKRLQKPRVLNLKCIPAAIMSIKQTEIGQFTVLKILCNFFFLPTESVIVVIVAHPVP